MSCGVGCRRGSDLVWLWCRQAGAAPIRLLAWEPPYAAGAALQWKMKWASSDQERGLDFILFKMKSLWKVTNRGVIDSTLPF